MCIRDRDESKTVAHSAEIDAPNLLAVAEKPLAYRFAGIGTVSYTHLTLPTSDLV